MKLFSIALVILGILAALAAALLVASLQSKGGKAQAAAMVSPDVKIVVANRNLPAMQVIVGEYVEEKVVPRAEAPAEYFSNAVQVVGKILALPMVEGQPFEESYLVREGTGRTIAASLNPGMRAVSFPIELHSGLDGILYPGSVVDVIVTLGLPGNGGRSACPEMVSVTLLEGVEVLGIGDKTIVSSDDSPLLGRSPSSSREQMITLMVNTKQAETLKLAQQQGKLSLAMRSPLDAMPVGNEGVRIADFSPEWFEYLRKSSEVPDKDQLAVRGGPGGGDGLGMPRINAPEPPRQIGWEVFIFRGEKRETLSVPLAGNIVLGSADR